MRSTRARSQILLLLGNTFGEIPVVPASRSPEQPLRSAGGRRVIHGRRLGRFALEIHLIAFDLPVPFLRFERLTSCRDVPEQQCRVFAARNEP